MGSTIKGDGQVTAHSHLQVLGFWALSGSQLIGGHWQLPFWQVFVIINGLEQGWSHHPQFQSSLVKSTHRPLQQSGRLDGQPMLLGRKKFSPLTNELAPPTRSPGSLYRGGGIVNSSTGMPPSAAAYISKAGNAS